MIKIIAIISLLWTCVTCLYIEKKVTCPENIKNQISIAPNDISKPLTCYEMNGLLKACTHGTFEPENCYTININAINNDKQLRVVLDARN